MIRQRDTRSTYVIRLNHVYYVTLQRLENNYNGNPRYEATIINTDAAIDNYILSRVYRFTGHFLGDNNEAEWIAKYHESKIKS